MIKKPNSDDKNMISRSDMSERNPKFFIWIWFFDHNFKTKWTIFLKFRTHISKYVICVLKNYQLQEFACREWSLENEAVY